MIGIIHWKYAFVLSSDRYVHCFRRYYCNSRKFRFCCNFMIAFTFALISGAMNTLQKSYLCFLAVWCDLENKRNKKQTTLEILKQRHSYIFRHDCPWTEWWHWRVCPIFPINRFETTARHRRPEMQDWGLSLLKICQ